MIHTKEYRIVEEDGVFKIQNLIYTARIEWYTHSNWLYRLFGRKYPIAVTNESWSNLAFPIPNPQEPWKNESQWGHTPLFSQVSSWSTRKEAEVFLKKLNES